MCYPMPVFIIGTYNADGSPNAMNAAWGGISEETEITICVDNTHKTAQNLLARKAFTVSMATAGMMTACDYVGIVSGTKEPEKFAKAGFHATKSAFVDAPLIDELPMALECEVLSYDEETCRLSRAIATEFGLLESGGSDFHGTNKPDISVGKGRGGLEVPDLFLERLKTACDGRKICP